MKDELKIISGLVLASIGLLGIFLLIRQKNTNINYQPMDKFNNQNQNQNQTQIQLPQPNQKGKLSVEEAIDQRRSYRQFTSQPLSLDQISQLAWAAQGITDQDTEFRSVPSAGALYPLEIFLVIGDNKVENVSSGVYHYQPKENLIIQIISGDLRNQLTHVSLGQDSINQAPVSIIITGVFERTKIKYGDRGERYVYLEAGHAGQNIYLQSEALQLGAVVIGAFNDQELIEALQLPENHQPIYVIPVGYPK